MAFSARAGATAGGSQAAAAGVVVPAELGYFAIYNPSLGPTDETLEDQIVYYYSAVEAAAHAAQRADGRRRSLSTSSVSSAASAASPSANRIDAQERNERLRQIGLAQGMVAFGKSFAGDQPVDTIETDKARIVLHELEPGWWLLVSVNLTQLPLPGGAGAVEYSSREVKPAALLLQDLLRAHAVFLLHHDVSLAALYARTTASSTASSTVTSPASASASSAPDPAPGRARFNTLMARYWDVFLSSWPVLLHGNPLRDVLPGVRMAACGELGVGVGEEDRGSGEREVLEGLVEHTDGLVDLVVCKFGGETRTEENENEQNEQNENEQNEQKAWLGTGREPGAEDGAIFLGVGAVARPSLRTLTYWMEDVYSWGDHAYGISENPAAPSRHSRRRRKKMSVSASIPEESSQAQAQAQGQSQGRSESLQESPHLLPPLPVTELAKRKHAASRSLSISGEPPSGSPGSLDRYMSFMKLGYGTYWSLGGGGGSSVAEDGAAGSRTTPDMTRVARPHREPDAGRFLIGLTPSETSSSLLSHSTRSVVVEMAEDVDTFGGGRRTERLRVVVFGKQPFLYVFLFRTVGMAPDEGVLQRLLGQQVQMLHKALLGSTAYRPEKPRMGLGAAASATSGGGAIYDLIWDPQALTIHSTVPNIPGSGGGGSSSSSSWRKAAPWTRVEALNTHMQLLSMFAATRANAAELERTCKTSRGWWLVWQRIVDRAVDAGDRRDSRSSRGSRASQSRASQASSALVDTSLDVADDCSEQSEETCQTATGALPNYSVAKEIFLVRRAGDHSEGKTAASAAMRAISASYLGRAAVAGVSGGAGGEAGDGLGWTDGATRLAQDMGVDTKKYIEGLLSLNR